MSPSRIVEHPRLGPHDQEITEEMAIAALPRRAAGAHKWGVGGVVIVAGAPGFVGAAALCAMAAGRAGAGIVSVAVPHGLGETITTLVPEAVIILLPTGDSPAIARRACDAIEPWLAKSTALVVGPGLGQDETANALLGSLFGTGASRPALGFAGSARAGSESTPIGLLEQTDKPVVIDADGLNWLAKQPRWWERLPAGRAVLTPHVGEMARLLDTGADQVLADPLSIVREAAARWNQTILLKGGFTAVSDGARTLVAADAPPSLATAGSGDVFAGTIGAFLAQGVAPVDAAALAIHVGALAARRVETRTGVLGLIASDLPLAIAEELARLERAAGVANG